MADYSSIGKKTSQSTTDLYKTAQQNSLDVTNIVNKSNDIRTSKRKAALKANHDVNKTGFNAYAKKQENDANIKNKQDVYNAEKGSIQYAGGVGALGLMADGYLQIKENRRQAKEREQLKLQSDAIRAEERAFNQKLYDQQQEVIEIQKANLKLQKEKLEGIQSGTGTNTSTDSSSSTQGQSAFTTPAPNAAGSIDLSKLTREDYDELAYAITSEAGGGRDKYGVAASILNRVADPSFPGTVKGVIRAPGQYEGVYKGLSTYDSSITDDLMSPSGQKELQRAFQVLDGRTDFKGQSQLHNRSSKGNKGGILDPMFDESGNFYHYKNQ